MKNIKFNINLTTIIIIGIILIIIFGGGFSIMNRINNKVKTELEEERKLVAALNDSLRITTNKYGEVVSEKLTLQTTIENLENTNIQLTEDQKELIRRLGITEKEKDVISAALIKANVFIDSLMHMGEVTIGDSIITFIETNNPNIQYTIDILNAMPVNTESTPKLLFKNLNIPNDTYVEFFWEDNKNDGYPVSFSVTNTNKYMEVYNIESYAIPSLQKEEIDPNAWQSFNQWLDDVSGNSGRYVVGGLIGFGMAVLIMR